MEIGQYQQQGDVLIKRVSKIPEDVKEVKRGKRGFVLAEGEATGHAHVIEDDIEMYEKNGVFYLRTAKTVEIKHEEHKTQIIEPGIYEIGRVVEYDHFLEESKSVQD